MEEKLMNMTVKYQSRGGNTKAVAETLATALGCAASSIDTPLVERTDIDMLFLGGGAYMGDADNALREFLQSLNPGLVGERYGNGENIEA
jgi:flavodoxin